MTVKYGILSQSTAVGYFLSQSVENAVYTRSCKKINKKKILSFTVKPVNFEKYRDIIFWPYRPALDVTIFDNKQKCTSASYLKLLQLSTQATVKMCIFKRQFFLNIINIAAFY